MKLTNNQNIWIRGLKEHTAKNNEKFYTFYCYLTNNKEDGTVSFMWYKPTFELKDKQMIKTGDLCFDLIKKGQYLNGKVISLKQYIPVKSTETGQISTIEDKPMEIPAEQNETVNISNKEDWDKLINDYNGEKIF